jgi:hypothetical protein
LIDEPGLAESTMVVPEAAVNVVEDTSQSEAAANPIEFATVDVYDRASRPPVVSEPSPFEATGVVVSTPVSTTTFSRACLLPDVALFVIVTVIEPGAEPTVALQIAA